MFSFILVTSLLSLALCKPDETPDSVRQAFIQAGLVPDVLSAFDPVLLLGVTYTVPETGKPMSVSPAGRNFTKPETLNSPTWSIPSKDQSLENETFVVAMIDPDAPMPQEPTHAQVRHFLGGGFTLAGPPCDKGAGTTLVNSTPALSDYQQPAPPNTSDPHRYTFLLYRQPLDFPTSISSNLTNFNISAFAEQFNLGPPLAGNFMTVSTKPPA